jgi:hypothetical protein
MRRLAAAPPPTDPNGLGSVAQDPDAVREQACRIVSSNQRVCSPPTTSAPKGSSGNFDLSFLGALFWVVLILLAVLALVMVFRSVGTRQARVQRTTTDATDDLDELESGVVAIDRSREPADWRREADTHRREGRFRDALRCRYRALVGDLARRGLIDEIPGRATGEERAQLRVVRPNASSPFDEAADLFDDAWYGHAVVDASADDRFQRLERNVLESVGERR